MSSRNKYPVGVEKFIPAIKEIAMHQINFVANARVEMSLIREQPDVFVRYVPEALAQDLVMKFSLPGMQRTVSLTAPKTWWSHFKTTWPVWLRKVLFWIKPPVWRSVWFDIGEVFPGIVMPDRYGRLVFFDMRSTDMPWSPDLDADPVQGFDVTDPPNLPTAKWGGGVQLEEPNESEVKDVESWEDPATDVDKLKADLLSHTRCGGVKIGDLVRVVDPESQYDGVIGDVVDINGPRVVIEQYPEQEIKPFASGFKCLVYDKDEHVWKKAGQ